MKTLLAIVSSLLLSGLVCAAELKEIPARPAAPLVLPSLAGGSLDIKGLKDQVVLVNFWAVWCPPCRKEMPSMGRLAERFAGQQFTLLGVNAGDSSNEINAFLKQVPVNFPIVLDENGNSLKPWQVFAFPTSYVVDKRGNIRMGLFGSIEWDAPETIARIEALIREP